MLGKDKRRAVYKVEVSDVNTKGWKGGERGREQQTKKEPIRNKGVTNLIELMK